MTVVLPRRHRLLLGAGLLATTLTMAGCGASAPSVGGAATTTPSTSATRGGDGVSVTAGGWTATVNANRLTVTDASGATTDLGPVNETWRIESISGDGRIVTFRDPNGATLHLLDTASGQWRAANGIPAPSAT